MTSPFAGWSAHEIIGPLNRREVRAALLEYNIERSCFRTWNTIEEMVLKSGDDVKTTLYESGLAKANVEKQHQLIGVKRHREAMAMARNVRRHIGKSSFNERRKELIENI